jgi:hypothetical protein
VAHVLKNLPPVRVEKSRQQLMATTIHNNRQFIKLMHSLTSMIEVNESKELRPMRQLREPGLSEAETNILNAKLSRLQDEKTMLQSKLAHTKNMEKEIDSPLASTASSSASSLPNDGDEDHEEEEEEEDEEDGRDNTL